MRKYEKACESGNYKYEEVEETKVGSNNTDKVIDLTNCIFNWCFNCFYALYGRII